MEQVFTEVDDVSCSFIGGGWNCIFRGRPGTNAPMEPGPTGKVTEQVEDVYVNVEGQSRLEATHEGADSEYAHAEMYFREEDYGEGGGSFGVGVCLHEPDRGRLRCGRKSDFDEMDQHYIESHS